ncbi:MAG: hypothetical protein MK098_06940 [Marinovum sp.]|nr:hypothetical protein [Marinovum sp.]
MVIRDGDGVRFASGSSSNIQVQSAQMNGQFYDTDADIISGILSATG